MYMIVRSRVRVKTRRFDYIARVRRAKGMYVWKQRFGTAEAVP
jgi:hypothetical protein